MCLCLCHCICLFVGQDMSPHHSDQMSGRSEVNWIVFCMTISSQWFSEWQGHLLSCSGQLKTNYNDKILSLEPKLFAAVDEKGEKLKWSVNEKMVCKSNPGQFNLTSVFSPLLSSDNLWTFLHKFQDKSGKWKQSIQLYTLQAKEFISCCKKQFLDCSWEVEFQWIASVCTRLCLAVWCE